MTEELQKVMDSISEALANLDYVRPGTIPNIDLYMDQVTTFMEEQLESTKRYPDDKILTKTMINNYAKNDLLPPPVKKKYSKNHVIFLIMIYYFKNFLTIKDIGTLLEPLEEMCFSEDADESLEEIYKEICKLVKTRIPDMTEDFQKVLEASAKQFENVPEGDREAIQKFAMICCLSFDVYVKKRIVESLIDELPQVDKKKKSPKG